MFPDDAQEILENFVRMLVFDALNGNNDRHFYNWGVIKDIKSKNCPKFAPVYDSAGGLFWNDSESKLEKIYGDPKQISDRIQKYAEGSRPKIGWDGLDDLNHFELIERIYTQESSYKHICESLITQENLNKMIEFLDVNFNSYLTDRRMKLIKQCLL